MADEPRPDATDEQHKLLVEAATAFVDVLDRHPGIEDTLEDTLERYLAPPPDTRVAARLRFAVHHVLGAQGGSFVLYYLESNEPEDVLAALDDVDADAGLRQHAEGVLRRLQAFYGYEVVEAGRIHGMNPLDWDRVEPHVAYETLEERWQVGLLIRRFDGESLRLEMTPNSIAGLGTWILRQLNAIGDDVFDPPVVDDLIGEITRLLAKFGGSVEFEVAGDGAPASGPPGEAADTPAGAGVVAEGG